MYDIQYNGITGASLGLLLYDYPEFSGAGKSYSTFPIVGGRGELVGTDDYISNLVISCTFSIKSEAFAQKIRQVKKWLSGTGELILSDSADVFYRVLKIDYDSIERELKRFGTFTVKFTCTPYEFLRTGKTPIEPDAYGTVQNPGDVSRPVYLISGNGDCTLTVNGNSMKAVVTDNLTIDTEKMLSYRTDGTIQNTAVTGDYEQLFLLEGTNKIQITRGFSLKIIPKWGYEV